MTSTGIQLEGPTKGYGRRPVLRQLSLSVAGGEILSDLGAHAAGTTTAVENTQALRRRDGGPIHVWGQEPAEQRGRVRHLVIFQARVL
jgi:ABC-type multidrug transport system ATPase subunit